MNLLMKYWAAIALFGCGLIVIGFASNSPTAKAFIGISGLLVLGLGVGCWWCRNDPVTNPDDV